MKMITILLGVLIISGCAKDVTETKLVGYIEADWVYIAAPEPGWITARPVTEGQILNIGDVVFELDRERQIAAVRQASESVEQTKAKTRDLNTGARPAEIRALEAKLEEANAQLTQARSERDRISPLVEQGIEPRNRGEKVIASYEMAVARVKAAKDAIDIAHLSGRKATKEAALATQKSAQAAKLSAEINLQRRTILAQTSGRIEEVFHYPGEFVPIGAPVVSLLPKDGLKVRFFVSQSELPKLKIGQVVNIKADGNKTAIPAKISYIASQAEYTPPVIYSARSREKLVFLIEATLPTDANLHPGLPVDVDFP